MILEHIVAIVLYYLKGLIRWKNQNYSLKWNGYILFIVDRNHFENVLHNSQRYTYESFNPLILEIQIMMPYWKLCPFFFYLYFCRHKLNFKGLFRNICEIYYSFLIFVTN